MLPASRHASFRGACITLNPSVSHTWCRPLIPLRFRSQHTLPGVFDYDAADAVDCSQYDASHGYFNFASLRAASEHVNAAVEGARSRRPFSIIQPKTICNPRTPPEVTGDKYADLHIFRRDMSDSPNSGGGKLGVISVDSPLKTFTDLFADHDSRRCKLCNETYMHWRSHTHSVPHTGRECMLLELVRPFIGTPEEIVSMFWYRLHHSPKFERIRSLSHDNSHIRKRRLQYILQFLYDRRIIFDVFNVQSTDGAGRTWEFERLEFLGDNVVKYILGNRLGCLFPVSEGGIKSRLSQFQFVVDGNDGLARGYDFLELQKLTKSDRIVSKFKSDCVETLFGELQAYLWATEEDLGTEKHALPFSPEMITLRALVRHALEELGHVLVMYHVESVLASLQRVAREAQLQFVRTDPSKRGAAASASEGIASHMTSPQQYHPGKLSAKKISPQMRRLNGGNGKAAPLSDSELYAASSNYESFKKVTSLGGLLPRPFLRDELAAVPNFLPQLQESSVEGPLSTAFRSLSVPGAASGLSAHRRCQSPTRVPWGKPLQLAQAPAPRMQSQTLLTVTALKDHHLVEELL